MFDRSLTVSVNTLNYPSCTLGFVNSYRTLSRTRLNSNPLLAMPPSSVLLQTDESGKFQESKKSFGSKAAPSCSDSLLNQENTVGIVGGASVDSTLNLLGKLVQLSGEENDFPFLLCSDPLLNKELLSHERSSFSSLNCKGGGVQLDDSLIVENLRRKRVFLEKAGARCIVMPCHLSHIWHDEVCKGCSVPFLHVSECVAKELKEANMKPLEAGSPLRIGVLAKNAILTAGFYQEKLQHEGFEVVLPDKATMEHTLIPALDALNRKDVEGARNLLRIALQVLLVRAVNTVILVSDDMQDLLPPDDPLRKKCIDPMDALARSTIKWVKSAEKGT
ncbi:hypothetical protein WN944_022287 [Citrus x changshan-huyou]|uniref:Aspartate racemase n=1 Tax=Citrus x changshan-huyou TaxID=2935761 RepID=A0AAP0N366_9ROSI